MNKNTFLQWRENTIRQRGRGRMPFIKEGRMSFIEGGSLSLREGSHSLREGAVHWGREPFFKRWSRSLREGVVLQRREPFIEGGSCLLRREPFFERGSCSSKEGAVLQRRKGGSHSLRDKAILWEREDKGWGMLFFKGGRTLFINKGRRTLFFERGTMLFVMGGSMPFAKEGTQFVDEGGKKLDRVVGRKNKEFPCREIQSST